MWQQICFIWVICSVSAIKVPVDNQDSATELQTQVQEAQSTPVLYIADDANVDSYLLPPDPHKPYESLPDTIITPATFLVPPATEKKTEYYIPAQANIQSDWLPILQAVPQNNRNARFHRPQQEQIPIFLNINQPEPSKGSLNIPVPPTHLVPPTVDAVNEFILPLPEDEELHINEHNEPIALFNVEEETSGHGNLLVKQRLKPVDPTLALHLTPPREQTLKVPTKLYPKKYAGGFKPVPIPLTLDDERLSEAPRAKPVKYFKPQPHPEVVETIPVDEKKLYKYKKAEHQRKLKQQDHNLQQYEADGVPEETHGRPASSEQQTSETNLRYPGRNAYPAPLRQPSPAAPVLDSHPAVGPAPDGRTEFRMHGMKGPHSYQFGYDTGKGKNRQFRYEERDNDGIVRGHYGYMDKLGKLRVVNYSAHPEYGFRAEEPKEEKK